MLRLYLRTLHILIEISLNLEILKYKLNVGTSSLQDKVVQTIVKIEGNTLIYCGSKPDVERFANHMLKNEEYLSLLSEKESKEDNELFSIF